MYLSLGGKYIIMKRRFTVNASEQISSTRKVDRWNEFTEQYEPVEIPDNWNVSQFSMDMDAPINCIHCGKPMTYGEGYTSRRYHDNHGFGYMECEDCYNEQLEEYRQARAQRAAGQAPDGVEASTDIMGAANDDKEDPKVQQADELHTRVEDDFDYVMAGIERLGREDLLDEAISILTTLAETLDSAIDIIGRDFKDNGSEEI